VVKYEPARIGVRDIIERIEDSGYGASFHAGGGDEADEMRARKEKDIRRWKVAWALLIHAVTMEGQHELCSIDDSRQ
jgi:hypothetical protein